MVVTLDLISQKRSIHEVKESLYYESRDITSFNQALHEMSDAGINPVTIPKSFGKEYCENLNVYLSCNKQIMLMAQRLLSTPAENTRWKY